jgi:hypothetical protein
MIESMGLFFMDIGATAIRILLSAGMAFAAAAGTGPQLNL